MPVQTFLPHPACFCTLYNTSLAPQTYRFDLPEARYSVTAM